ncbi:cationic amino acid transporter 6, chloroplastic-like [Dioscorea cayenensis subsp. rotundata]|uniref:Cationic amino acid transporter 6, chloroplastic-like n=1 Tax=Dioscorea cayennensis subsp. rotundata TaxID=55577 RepID=A0AB40BF80_DIOCR|nr:cationic amino acid transporter 6, chloroplastic-like [Dioscorea cayenensis subsp. rotundata]
MHRGTTSNNSSNSNSNSSSFSSPKAYFHALTQTHRRLVRRACSITTTRDEMSHVRARSGAHMARSLRWPDLITLGLGGMVGAGVFISTGRAARLYAGPAVILSYAIAGLCALLSAFCYTEFAVHLPVAGGAFSYLRVTFGEFAAFLTGANLLMEYVFSNAAVARSFTAYLGTAIGVNTTEKLRFQVSGLPDGFNQIDLLAVILIILITFCICYSTKESSAMNMMLTGTHMGFILFIIIMGFMKGSLKNFTKPLDPTKNPSGFIPYGVSGVFAGASMVYLSYIGYDTVSTMAEEVEDPVHDIPIGVSGSVVLVTLLYCLMAASISMLVPYDTIDTEAPFSSAFKGSDGWDWVSKVIGVGATLGIVASLLVAMLGQARYLCVIARSNMVPLWLARVHPTTATPVNASVFLGVVTASIALFTDLNILLNLVSIGTLFVFYMVANAVIFQRYVACASTNICPTIIFLFSFSFISITFTIIWNLNAPGKTTPFLLCGCIVVAVMIVQVFKSSVAEARKPELWGVPLMPWIPSVSVFLNVVLLGCLDKASYLRFGVFSLFVVVVYLMYSVHASFDAQENEDVLLTSSSHEYHADDGILNL